MTHKRVGQILREAREDRKLSIKDVAKDTNIAARYILALETEDYTQFPAETFALGFLKNYASYLKLDNAMLINLYRGEKIEEAQAPLEELTRPTSGMSFDFGSSKIWIAIAIVAVSIAGYYLYDSLQDSNLDSSELSSNVDSGTQPENPNEIPASINFVTQSVPDGVSVPFILTEDRGVSFSVSNQLCKIFIRKVEPTPDGKNKVLLGFNIYPERNIFQFETSVNDETILSYKSPELESLRREIKIATQAVTAKSAKILVTLGEEKEGTSQKPQGDVPIQVALIFSKPSYVEFIIDGQMGERGLVQAGETKQLEAKDRLEIKVGDGGAVEIVQNGKEKARLGRPGKLVKKIFVKTQNPYDSTQFIIKELGE